MNDVETSRRANNAGLVESAMRKIFMRSATIVEVADVGDAFRLITVDGDALRDASWTPGDKIQVQLGGWVQRTYTPIDWDSEEGLVRILVFLHANGPGTQWASSARAGDECIVFGPRKSIDLTRFGSALVVLFGDETSIGLALALRKFLQPESLYLFLEVSSLAESQAVIAHFGLEQATLREHAENDLQLLELQEKMLSVLQATPASHCVLTGKASSIQQIQKRLKKTHDKPKRFQTKAYWAAGKKGLD